MTLVDTLPLVSSPTVTPVVEIGLGDTFEQIVGGLWQTEPPTGSVVTRWQQDNGAGTDNATSHWTGDQPFWVDVSCHVREVSTFCGRERANETWEVGTATIVVDNVGGWADYPHSTDPDVLLYMRPGRQIRVGVVVDDGTVTRHDLWGGYIDGMSPGFDPDDGEFVTLECIDAKGEAGRGFLGELAAPVGAGETASARAARILNSASWPLSRRSMQSTSVILLATSYDGQVVDLLNLAADSAGAACFGDVNGNVAFRQRDWQSVAIRDVAPIGTISNMGGEGFACAASWEQAFNREDISTRVTVGNPDGVPVTVRNVPAFNLYGEEVFERTDLETQLSADLSIIANRVLEVRSPDYMPRIVAVTLNAGADANSVDIMGRASPYVPSTVRAAHHGVDGRVVFNRLMMVVGAEHTITPDDGWECRLALDDAEPFQVGASDGSWSDGVAGTGYWNPTEPTAPTPPAFVTRWSAGA